jgi:uncharacterized repeat protein (TIGR01451 family)
MRPQFLPARQPKAYRFKELTTFATLLALGILANQPSKAATKPSPVRTVIQVFRVEIQNGRETLVESQTAEPGDFVVYRVRYENAGRAVIPNFSPELTIPNPMIYVANSASPGNVMASVDPNTFAPVPLVKAVRLTSGAQRKVRIAPSEYRALKWNLGPLKPGQSVVVSARVQLPIPRRAMRKDLVA